MPKTETPTPAEAVEAEYICILSYKSPGGFHTVTPAESATDHPPHSRRETITAKSDAEAQRIADSKYAGMEGAYRVFPVLPTTKEGNS